MIKTRKSEERGRGRHGWLDSYHTFSFAQYYDPQFMGFGPLRVINEDWIQGGSGFGTHGHKDMEIISYVIEGALEHKDSMGHSTLIQPGEVQRMSAGTGVQHSEFNPLPDQKTHLLQIWFLPSQTGLPPSYEQKNFTNLFDARRLTLVASEKGRENSISLHQDVDMWVGKFQQKGSQKYNTKGQRSLWIQIIKGKITLKNISLFSGDGAALKNEGILDLEWEGNSEFILWDMK